MASLTNKTALVTGASRGIGRATASALAQAGAHVLVHYGRSCRMRNLSLPASAQKGDARMRSGGLGNSRRRDTAGEGSSLNCWRAIGCARVQRRDLQGCNHQGSYGGGF